MLRRYLVSDGLTFVAGPFRCRLYSRVTPVIAAWQSLYADYPLAPDSDLDDFRLRLDWATPWRRYLRPVVRFSSDGPAPYTDVPVNQALALFEWGANWCIATRAHHLLMLHAAVVARDDLALILPAWPGHGKSTLCAALIQSGWRLLSDEFGLVRPADGRLLPLPRPVGLKNASIDVIRAFAPDAFIGPLCPGTHKGTVAHLRPPADSVARAAEPALPRWLVFPRWIAAAPLRLEPLPKGEAFMMVATNAFNYEVLGQQAFDLVAQVVRACDCLTLRYSALPEAIAALDALAESRHG